MEGKGDQRWKGGRECKVCSAKIIKFISLVMGVAKYSTGVLMSVFSGGASKCQKLILSFHQIWKTLSVHQNFPMCSFCQKLVFPQVTSKCKKNCMISMHQKLEVTDVRLG